MRRYVKPQSEVVALYPGTGVMLETSIKFGSSDTTTNEDFGKNNNTEDWLSNRKQLDSSQFWEE